MVKLRVEVKPNSSVNKILIGEDGLIKIKVTASPVEGKANKAVIKLLSKELKVAKQDLKIASGAKSKTKLIKIDGMGEEELRKWITQRL